MDNNKTTEGKGVPTPTGVFEVDNYKSGVVAPVITPVENGGSRAVSEKTLKKRLARLSASPLMLAMAVLLGISAVLTLFRGYFWPFTAAFALHRILAAVSAFLLYFTAGKRGGKLLAAAPLYASIASVTGLVFLSVFIFCGMFGKMLLVSGEKAEEWVRLIHGAGLWALIPSLVCLVIAYCLYLFKRHERLFTLNVRDGLRYGFAFEKGYGSFSRSAVILAAVLFVLQVVRGFIGSFADLGWFPDNATALYDRLFLAQNSYVVNLLGVIIHCAALGCAIVLALRYATAVKKYKLQRELRREAKRAEEQKMQGDNGKRQGDEDLKKARVNRSDIHDVSGEASKEFESVKTLADTSPKNVK